jgi:hypothetical protein
MSIHSEYSLVSMDLLLAGSLRRSTDKKLEIGLRTTTDGLVY